MRTFKVVIAFLIALGVYGLASPTQKTEAASSTKAVVSAHYYKEIKSLKYPQVSGLKSKAAESKINTVFLNTVKASYNDYVKLKAKAKEDQKKGYCTGATCNYVTQTDYQTKYNTTGKLSVAYNEYQYTGGAHGSSLVTDFNFNLSTGQQYKINDILKTTSNYKKVSAYAYRYLSTHEPWKESFFGDPVTVNKNTQFYFKSGGIVLQFQEYDVCAYAAGQPTVPVPSYVYQ